MSSQVAQNKRWAVRRWYKYLGCFRCDAKTRMTLDHIIPRKIRRDWGHFPGIVNLQFLCEPCHREKARVENGLKGQPWWEQAYHLVAHWDFTVRVREQ